MASKSPNVRNALIAEKAKKMELDAAIARVSMLRKEHKICVETLKSAREDFKNGKATAGPRLYVDNPANRKKGRVGKPIIYNKGKKGKKAEKKVSNVSSANASAGDSSAKVVKCYADNDANRKSGRVGKPIPRRNGKKKKKKTTKAEEEIKVVEVQQEEEEEEEVVQEEQDAAAAATAEEDALSEILDGDNDSDSDSGESDSSSDGF